MHIARMINHQKQIIEKIEEIARIMESLAIAKVDLKDLIKMSESEVDKSFEEMTKLNRQ